MKKKLAVLLVAALTLGMTACGASKGAGDTGKSEKSTVYAVEAGSAGEEAAKEKGFQYNSFSSQADALMEVASGTSDAAIIDLLMAGAMIGEGTSYPNLKHTDELTTEEYGVGCRKGSDLASYINQVFADSYKDGSMEKIAETYGVQEALVEQKDATFEQSEKDSDVDYIKGRGKLVVGVTDFEPMDYKDKDGNWKSKFVGYRYDHIVKVEFPSDNKRLGRILYALANNEALTPDFRFSFFVKDVEGSKNELLGKAVTDAKAKAEVLTKAAGVALQEIISIDYSWGEIDFVTKPMNEMRLMECTECEMSAPAAYDIDIEADDIDVTDTVTVVWEIA